MGSKTSMTLKPGGARAPSRGPPPPRACRHPYHTPLRPQRRPPRPRTLVARRCTPSAASHAALPQPHAPPFRRPRKQSAATRGSAAAAAAAAAPGAAPAAPCAAETGAAEPATWRDDYARADVKHGRFSEEEKAALARAVAAYAAAHGCSTEDYSWLLQRAGGGGRRGGRLKAGEAAPATEVAAALPGRTRKAVFAVLQRMFSEGRGKVRGRAGRRGPGFVGGSGRATWAPRACRGGSPRRALHLMASACLTRPVALCCSLPPRRRRARGQARRTRSFGPPSPQRAASGPRSARAWGARASSAATAGGRSASATRGRRVGGGLEGCQRRGGRQPTRRRQGPCQARQAPRSARPPPHPDRSPSPARPLDRRGAHAPRGAGHGVPRGLGRRRRRRRRARED
jgi:hypothetical protein